MPKNKRLGSSNLPKTSEDALSQEFARYLAEVTRTFAEPMREGVREQERQLLQRQGQVQSDLEAYHGQILTETTAIKSSLREGLMDYVGTMKDVRADTKKAVATVDGMSTALEGISANTKTLEGSIFRRTEALKQDISRVERRVDKHASSNQERLILAEQRVMARIEASKNELLQTLWRVESKADSLAASVSKLRTVLIVFAVSQGIVLASLLSLAIIILNRVRVPGL